MSALQLMSQSPPTCPCCGAGDSQSLGSLPDSTWFAGRPLNSALKGGDLYRCTTCSLKFRFPLQSEERYRELYDNSRVATWTSGGPRADWDRIILQVERCLPQGGRILDFGCYTGGLLMRLGARYERFGVEVNRHAASVASSATGVVVWPSINDAPEDSRFDAITISDVIEHLPNPMELLDRLQSRLAENGVVIITTGDADAKLWNFFGSNWWYCFYPEHIAFISRLWVERVANTQGWIVLHVEHFRYRQVGAMMRLIELVGAFAYGFAPRAYLWTCNSLRHWGGRRALITAPGNGVSVDHILVTLSCQRIP